jgi:hypothetical protein
LSRVGETRLDWFEAHGLGVQRITVVPSLGLAVVITTGLYAKDNAEPVTTFSTIFYIAHRRARCAGLTPAMSVDPVRGGAGSCIRTG